MCRDSIKRIRKYLKGEYTHMSTRGYLTLVDGKKNILSAAYLPSDAYPSYWGMQALNAFQNNSFLQLINQVNHDYPEDTDVLTSLRRDWYVKNNDNKDEYFTDYAYELNGDKGELTVFHYGDKALTIPYEQISLYQFIFEHEDSLYAPVCLDEKSMTLKKDFYRELRRMIKDGADEDSFQNIMNQNEGLLYMDQGRCVDPWNRNTDSFNKFVRDTNWRKLQFCVHESFGKFYLYVQTPFIRAVASPHSFSSAKAAEKAIADFIRTRPADISATISFFEELKTYQDAIKAIFAQDDRPLDARAEEAHQKKVAMVDCLNHYTSSHNLFGNNDHLYDREIKDVVFRNYRYARERQDELMRHESLDAVLTAAETKKDTNAAIQTPTPNVSVER